MDKQGGMAKSLFWLAVNTGWQRFLYQQQRAGWSPRFLLWPLLDKLVAQKVLARPRGRLRAAISGGAALSEDVARVFIGLGLPIVQGYGLTETSPVVSANPLEDNIPASVGKAYPWNPGTYRRERRVAGQGSGRDAGLLEQSQGDRPGDRSGWMAADR